MNIGLYTGAMGILLTRLIESKMEIDKVKQQEITSLIRTVAKQLGVTNNLCFRDGITGIGWAIEWCAQHQLLEINSDKVLVDIDDLLYRSTVYASSNNLSLSELVGRANYFYRRGVSKNKHQNRYRHLCHRECLFLVLEDIEHVRNSNDVKFANDVEEDYFLSSYFLLLSRILMLKDETIETIFYNVAEKITERLEQAIIISANRYDISHLYSMIVLAEVFIISSRYTRHCCWERKGKAFLNELYLKVGEIEEAKRDRLVELILCVLYYAYSQEDWVNVILQDFLSHIPYNELQNTFYRGKGMVDIINLIIKSPQHITDMEDLMLLQAII